MCCHILVSINYMIIMSLQSQHCLITVLVKINYNAICIYICLWQFQDTLPHQHTYRFQCRCTLIYIYLAVTISRHTVTPTHVQMYLHLYISGCHNFKTHCHTNTPIGSSTAVPSSVYILLWQFQDTLSHQHTCRFQYSCTLIYIYLAVTISRHCHTNTPMGSCTDVPSSTYTWLWLFLDTPTPTHLSSPVLMVPHLHIAGCDNFKTHSHTNTTMGSCTDLPSSTYILLWQFWYPWSHQHTFAIKSCAQQSRAFN